MKRSFLFMAALCASLVGMAQQDSTQTRPHHHHPHFPMGPKAWDSLHQAWYNDTTHHRWPMPPHHNRMANISTNWLVLDIGFTNYNDRTNYSGAAAQTFAPGSAQNWFDLNNRKSVDINIWLFMQRLNLIKHVVNLKYGLGVELNNYRYRDDIKFETDPTTVVMDQIHYSKNKLAADYVTVPMMLNFNFTPRLEHGFGLSVGASAGYLYSSRQKLISDENGKMKTHDDFDLNPWKISWIGELQLGPVKLFGSYATKSMWRRGLDQTPYTIGIRFSNW